MTTPIGVSNYPIQPHATVTNQALSASSNPHTTPMQLAADEHVRLLGELRQLSPAQWTAPSSCAGWRNGRVVAHLAAGAELYRRSICRALQGDAAWSDAAAESLACFEARQERWSESPPVLLLAAFAASSELLDRVYQSLTPDELSLPAWHPMRQVTVGMLLAFRVFELGFHGWDVRASVDPRATIQGRLTPFLVGFVRQAQFGLCTPALELDITARFQVDPHEAWTTVVRDGKLAAAPPDAHADVEIQTDRGTFLLLATRRRTLAEVAGRVTIYGDGERAAAVLRATSFSV
ncbi:MAG TPA: maleylpyruvate isomerase N-terminal domain-containing protein [Chloroflexota bacterium]